VIIRRKTLFFATKYLIFQLKRGIRMKKHLFTTLMAGLFAALVPTAQAATVAGTFDVTVTLTSVCTMAAVTPLAFGTYTAFQGTAQTATNTTATLTCTRGLTGVTAKFDTAAPGSTAAAAATNAVGAGVIQGLQYDITATPGAVVAGNAATASFIGTADSRPYTISGSMPSGQAGDPTQNSSPQARTLTITY
jgi:spore coat protein U-like protein